MFFDFAQVRTVLLLRVQLVQLRLARQLVVVVLPERQVAVSRLGWHGRALALPRRQVLLLESV